MKKFLFVTYCFGGDGAEAVVHVYRRGLQMVLELHQRGHKIFFFCTGRESYRDALTERAETYLHFVDLPYRDVAFAAAEQQKQLYHHALAELAPDAIVIGEAPLGGALLQVTLTGVEAGVPVVIVDNARDRQQVQTFCREHGPMADGIILNGPPSSHIPAPPRHLCQTIPFPDKRPDDSDAYTAIGHAATFLERLPPTPRRDTEAECADLGFRHTHVHGALQARYPQSSLQIHWVRAAHLRNCADHAIYALVCAFERDGAAQVARLWGRIFASPRTRQAYQQAAEPTETHVWSGGHLLLQDDPGAAALPPLII